MNHYKVQLSRIEILNLNRDTKRRFFLYADFNVINYLYEKGIKVPHEIVLYYDSTAVQFALWVTQFKKIRKQVSTDILYNTLKKYKRIYLFGGVDDTLISARENIVKQYKDIDQIDIQNGYDYSNDKVLEQLNSVEYDIIFVGLGLKRQEEWVIKYYRDIHQGLLFTSGGWFEYIAEEKKRAPHYIRKYHLEWFHKLINEFPRIWKRYLIGFPIFLIRILTRRITLEIE